MGALRTNIPIALASAQSGDRSVSSQRLLNAYAEKMPENAKEPVEIITREGLYPVMELGSLTGTVDDGIHLLLPMGDKMLAICGVEAYSVGVDMEVSDVGNVGAASGVARGATDGITAAIVKENGELYTVDQSGALARTDLPDAEAQDVAFSAGRYVIPLAGTGRFRVSDLLDPTSWPGALIFTAEYAPDFIVGCAEFRGDVWIFGERTAEIWGPTDDADAPFQRLQSGVINMGCVAKGTIAKDKARIYWLTDDLEVMAGTSYNPARISTHSLEDALLKAGGSVSEAFAYCYTLRGHDFYVLSIDGVMTWVYDATTGLWHERDTFGRKDWLPSCAARFNDTLYAGESHGNRLLRIDSEWLYDGHFMDGVQLVREIVFPTVSASDASIIYDKVWADIFVADGVVSASLDPKVMLQWSDDGGRTWSNTVYRSIGKRGQYLTRAIWRSLGQSRQRIFRLRMSDPVKL